MSIDLELRPLPAQPAQSDESEHIDSTETPETPYVPEQDEVNEAYLAPCGTFTPGAVLEPCQHSVHWVRCCSCAGCLNDVWSCGRQLPRQSWLVHVYQGFIGFWATSWGLMVFALLVIVALTDHGLEVTAWILYMLIAIAMVLGLYALASLIHAGTGS